MKALTLALLGLFLVNMSMATAASARNVQCPDSDEGRNEMILDDGPTFLTSGRASRCLREVINEERKRLGETGQQISDQDIVVQLQQGAALAIYGQLPEDAD